MCFLGLLIVLKQTSLCSCKECSWGGNLDVIRSEKRDRTRMKQTAGRNKVLQETLHRNVCEMLLTFHNVMENIGLRRGKEKKLNDWSQMKESSVEHWFFL